MNSRIITRERIKKENRLWEEGDDSYEVVKEYNIVCSPFGNHTKYYVAQFQYEIDGKRYWRVETRSFWGIKKWVQFDSVDDIIELTEDDILTLAPKSMGWSDFTK